MLKVLVADDEKKVCHLIVNLVGWEQYGFEITGVANDGISAYQFLQDHPVDVMITDIRMPGCDGLELIQKSKVLYPDLYIVIISGYSQFEYAQNAIRYGVEDYLLKPIRKKDLTATLQKILEKCKENIQDARRWQDMEERLKENEEKVKRSLLEDLLKRPEKFGGFYSKDKINEEYHYRFEETGYQTAVIKVLPKKRREDAQTRRILLQKALEILDDSLSGLCNETVTGMVDGEIYGIFNGEGKELEGVARKLIRAKLELVRLQDMFDEVQVFIALGGSFDSIARIRESFRMAESAMQSRFYYGDAFLLEERGPEDGSRIAGAVVDNSFKKRFLSYIEILDLDSIRNELDLLREKLEHSPERCGSAVYAAYKEVLTIFCFGVHNYNISIPDQYPELLAKIELFGTIQEVIECLKSYITNSLSHWIDEKKYIESRPIRIAKQYIGAHYPEPLTLEMVSKEIGFNPTYFSSVFKKETDMNFSDYLMKIRIENAKNLLLNTEQSVEDVSFAVGYSDIKYFSRLFKKLAGITPTEFRRLYD